jgi:hypothetical protein
MGSGLGRGEEDWKRQSNWSCNTHMHGTTQGNSLCSYPYLKLAKQHDSHFIFHGFSSATLENRRAEQVLGEG